MSSFVFAQLPSFLLKYLIFKDELDTSEAKAKGANILIELTKQLGFNYHIVFYISIDAKIYFNENYFG